MLILEILIAIGFTIVGFVGTWLGASVVVKTTEFISRKLHLSSFVVSFLVLGTLTTIPEMSILYTSLRDGDLKVSLGNLMGGILAIICLIIPIFAIIRSGVKIKNSFEKNILGFVVLFALVPFLLGYDNRIDGNDALLIFVCYGFIVYKVIRLQNHNTNQEINKLLKLNIKIIDLVKHILGLPLGLLVVFVCSDILFKQILFFANLFNLNTFIISLFVLGIGTNLPEFSIMFSAIRKKYSEIALGDYLGSIVTNLFLISLAIFLGGPTTIHNNMVLTAGFAVISFSMFYLFFRLNEKLSSYEGYVLVFLYVIFSFLEFWLA